MRHSCVTAGAEGRRPNQDRECRLGHASETFTAWVYQHALPGMDREAAGVIAALFLGDQAITGVASPLAKTTKMGTQRFAECPFSLVAVTGFEPATSGL
jgi:hypothetical protein